MDCEQGEGARILRDLFPANPDLPDGVAHLHRWCATDPLLPAVEAIARVSPFRRMRVPGGGRMSAAMTNCGVAGWVSDTRGYRYDRTDPETGAPWPDLPPVLADLADRAARDAGFGPFAPDMCLINAYDPKARLGPHRDSDEQDFGHPIVSVSIGLPATFLWYGDKRSGTPRRIPVEDGDVIVFWGAARLGYHGVAPVPVGNHPRTGARRINLTLRKAL